MLALSHFKSSVQEFLPSSLCLPASDFGVFTHFRDGRSAVG
jgi:hypothetical protein